MGELLRDGEQWRIHHGDCIPHMLDGKEGGMNAESVDFAIFSPPFPVIIRIHG
jgi:hypothetical protein